MSNVKLSLLSILSGLLFSIAWPAIGDFSPALFVAFLPLLFVEWEMSKQQRSNLALFAQAFLGFFVFNFLCTFWIKNADFMGATMAILCNSFFMSTVFLAFHLTKKYVGQKEGYLSLLIYWVAFEYLHINWELSWIWLCFGHAFAKDIFAIQWYEYTGILGGSVWVLSLNIILFQAVKRWMAKKSIYRILLLASGLLVLPVLFSYVLYSNYEESGETFSYVVVQPNIDPYTEKFNGIPPSDQIDRMVNLAKSKLNEKTDYLVLPETAFPEALWEHELEYLYGTEELRKLIDSLPKLKIIVGMSTSILYTAGMTLPETADQFRDGSGWYTNHNTAIQLDSSSFVPFHHKSKLVLGVEKLPFVRSIPLMQKLSINLGGTSGGMTPQEQPSVFAATDRKAKMAPIICYESIYGEYVTQYTRSGANLFCIITNDGWWGDTPGYRQHLTFASLRAIENRRSIARSANTGTSAFINQKGEISQATAYWEQAVIAGELKSNENLTFYAKHGDYLGRTAGFIAPLLLLLALVKKLNKTGNRLSASKPQD